jgi:hypothetical protein
MPGLERLHPALSTRHKVRPRSTRLTRRKPPEIPLGLQLRCSLEGLAKRKFVEQGGRELAVHPVAALFPMLADDELQELAGGRAQLPPQLAQANQENKLAPCKLASMPAHMLNQTYTDSGIPPIQPKSERL